LRLVAFLELGIAVLGLDVTLALAHSPQAFVSLKAVRDPLDHGAARGLLVGSMQHIEFRVAQIQSRVQQKDVAGALGGADVLSATELLENTYFRWFITVKR
jgi:hypothetical protein